MITLKTTMEGPARRRPPYFKTKKLAIVGCTESVVHTPWTDARWTILAHNSARQHCRREPDWWMDLHRPECFKAVKAWNTRYWTWLSHLTTPIFMQEDYPEIPAAVRYPKERILAEFRPYFTNQVAWMIALAMTEGIETIGLFGCQYKHGSEYGIQRGSCEYWLGRFEQSGGRVILPQPNNLLATPSKLYGYESHDEHGKLIPEYRSKPVVAVVDETRTSRWSALTIVGGTEALPPLRDIGQPPALDRSARYGQTLATVVEAAGPAEAVG